MVNTIKSLVKKLAECLENDCKIVSGGCFSDILAAYNRYQEDEENGVNYLFNINDKGDVITVLDGGMAVWEFNVLYMKCHEQSCVMFLYGENYPQPKIVCDPAAFIKGNLLPLAACIVAYPHVSEYQKLYSRYITDIMLEHCDKNYMGIRDFC